ncbi:MAG TPA: hypothetical protein VHK69_17685 [Chitinophagaceae bacterium]|jgi:uncharacterized membrane protein|nr:hypothetical protein [Chitinophagaceae bacterium]
MLIFAIITIIFIIALVYFLGFAAKKKNQGQDLGEQGRGTM